MKPIKLIIKKAALYSIFFGLLIFNVKVITTDEGFNLKFIADILAVEWDCSQDPEGCGPDAIGSSEGHWENYGTKVKQVSVPIVTWVIAYEGLPPMPVLRMEVTYKVVREYWLVEKCDPGGKGCKIGAGDRETYQGTAG